MQRRIGHIAGRSQAIDRPRQRELGGAEAGDEVAATHLTALLEHLQHAVRRRVAALDTLGQHRLACHHPVPFEQLQRRGVSRLRRRWSRHAEGRDQRPATGTGRWANARQSPRSWPAARGRGRSRRLATRQHRPQRRQGIVGDLARPHQIPQRGEQFPIGGVPRRGTKLVPEAGAARSEMGADGIVQHPIWRLGNLERRVDHGELVREVEPDATVVRADRAAAHPDDVAGGAQLVEIGSAIAAQPRRQEFGLQRRRHQRSALQLSQRLDQRVEATTLARNAVPHLDEAGVRLGLDRLDLTSQGGQRAAT